jgi:hypothetical protein
MHNYPRIKRLSSKMIRRWSNESIKIKDKIKIKNALHQSHIHIICENLPRSNFMDLPNYRNQYIICQNLNFVNLPNYRNQYTRFAAFIFVVCSDSWHIKAWVRITKVFYSTKLWSVPLPKYFVLWNYGHNRVELNRLIHRNFIV